MSEYTPTTNEVRADFVALHTRNFDAYAAGRSLTSEEEYYGEDFDRWLDQVRAEERERIARRLSVEHAKAARNIKSRYGQGQIDAYADAARIARETT